MTKNPSQEFITVLTGKNIIPLKSTPAGYTMTVASPSINKSVDLLIDTGATASILPQSVLSYFPNAKKQSKMCELYGYNNMRVPILGLYKVPIVLPVVGKINHEFVISQTNDLTAAICGLDLISKIKASLIYIPQSDKHCLSIPQATASPHFTLSIVKKHIVPSQTVELVNIVCSSTHPISDKQQLLIQPCKNVLPCVSELQQLSHDTYEVSVVLVNCTNIDVELGSELTAEAYHEVNYNPNNQGQIDLHVVDEKTFETLSPIAPIFTIGNFHYR